MKLNVTMFRGIILLLADEDDKYRSKVKHTFGDKYQILEAADLDSALACIENKEDNVVSAVIVSATLPGNGAEALLKILRQNPLYWRVPVLSTIPARHVLEDVPVILETDDFLCKCHPLFDLQRRVERLMGMAQSYEREITLKDEASRDYMTGLYNRRGLQAALESLRKEDRPLAIYVFDLDDLKKVNDTKGHEEGDKLIQSFADLLRRKTRTKDILCRYGGDEFIVVLKHLNDKEAAVKKGNEICQAFHSSCSAGVVICQTEENNFFQMIQRADEALYRAKRKKKGSCCLWNEQ